MSLLTDDRVLHWLLRGIAALAGAVVVLIVAFLAIESVSGLVAVGPVRFFADPSWHPTAEAAEGAFNLLPMVVGTLLVTAGAVLLATSLGLASALFCEFYAPAPLARAYRRLIELLAGIPSVVYGFWGLVVLVPILHRWLGAGQSVLAAALILAMMILPTVALLGASSLRAVPMESLRGAAALGLSRWGVIRAAAWPVAKAGVFTAIILATGRAIGETMAVLMVAGNVVQVPQSVREPVRTLTANIALEMGYAAGDHRAALFVSGLVLMGVVVVLVTLATRFGRGDMHA